MKAQAFCGVEILFSMLNGVLGAANHLFADLKLFGAFFFFDGGKTLFIPSKTRA
jgi:hypothetical protein